MLFLSYFSFGDEKSEALRILTPLLVDQYNAYRVIEEVLEEQEDKEDLKKWTLFGSWK